MDCTPNEKGQASRFNVLHLYTPTDFLEDLAKRLMSTYVIEVSVVDGEKGGLVLRREKTNKMAARGSVIRGDPMAGLQWTQITITFVISFASGSASFGRFQDDL